MDFSHPYYQAASQPYQFVGIPPLTPSHSNSAASDDYNNASPPDATFDQFPTEHHQFQQQFDTFANPFSHPQQHQQHHPHAHHAGPTGFPSPPTPPSATSHPTAAAAAAAAAVTQPAHGLSIVGASIPPALAPVPQEPAVNSIKHDVHAEEQARRDESKSDDDDMTPQQSRRKAQNRAAQRAFRERKERHVKDLEQKLASLEAQQQSVATENERLKQDLQKAHTENEILRTTATMVSTAAAAAAANGASPGGSGHHPLHHGAGGFGGHMPLTTGPLEYNPTDWIDSVLVMHPNKTPVHRIVVSESGERLYSAGATWDLITKQPEFERGLINLTDVSDRLKTQAKCDGQGPVFEESDIRAAILASINSSGNDGLL